MKKQIINIVFVFGIFLFLTASLVRTIVFPKAINYYENRKAVTLEKPGIRDYMDGSLQDNVEAAISDQALFAQRMKKAYNVTVSGYTRMVFSQIASRYPNQYLRVGTYYLYDNDNLLFAPYDFSSIAPALDKRVNGFNSLFKKYPDIEFYLYYIEKDTDINFETNEKIGVAEYIKQHAEISDENFGVFEVNDFKEFDQFFFKTDHHWNARGSHKGYKEVTAMLLPHETHFLEPEKTINISNDFSGSKTLTKETATYDEGFSVYQINYPQMNIYVNGIYAADYGSQQMFIESRAAEALTYGAFYGGDFGEVIFDTGREDRENLLVVGESFDNAILKAVASHFNRTVSVDMRYYKDYMGKDFSFEECLEANNIDKVLFIGNIDYFVSDIFEVEK